MVSLGLVIDHLKLEYDGIFGLKGLFTLIANWAFERDMEKTEVKNTEHDLPEGKALDHEIFYTKRLTDYTILVFRIRILCFNIKKVEVMKEKRREKLDQGRVIVILDSFVQNDSENKWDDLPILVFFRTMFDKFIYKAYTERFERQTAKFTHELYQLIERYLNVHTHPKLMVKTPKF